MEIPHFTDKYLWCCMCKSRSFIQIQTISAKMSYDMHPKESHKDTEGARIYTSEPIAYVQLHMQFCCCIATLTVLTQYVNCLFSQDISYCIMHQTVVGHKCVYLLQAWKQDDQDLHIKTHIATDTYLFQLHCIYIALGAPPQAHLSILSNIVVGKIIN